MPEVKLLRFNRGFTIGELVDIGRRLSEKKLDKMRLLDYVKKAEKENVWRLKAAMELLKPLTHIHREVLWAELKRAEAQLVNPTRGQAKEVGGYPVPGQRTLPKPGIVLRCTHSRGHQKTFRFLVVEQPGKLLWLGDPSGPVYRNPSSAARKATRTSVNGWDYFNIK